MLRDAAGLAADDVGLAHGVEQRGLAVVDMAHDRDDRRARLQLFLDILFAAQTVSTSASATRRTVWPNSVDDQFGGVGVDHLVDRRHDALRISTLITSAPRSAMRLASSWTVIVSGIDDIADDLLLLALLQPLAFAFPGAAHRGQAAHPLALVVGEGAGDGQLAAATLLVAPDRRGGTLGRYNAGPPSVQRRFLLLLGGHRDLAGGGERRDFGGGSLAGPLGDLAAESSSLRRASSLSERFFASSVSRRRAFFLHPAARLILGATESLLGGLLGLFTLPIGIDEGLAPALLLGILKDAHSGGVFLRRKRPRHAGGAAGRLGRPGSRRFRCGGSGTGDGRRRRVAARSLDGRGARRDDTLLADLDRHLLRAPVREALAHRPAFRRPGPQSQRAAGTQRQRTLPCSVRSWSFASAIRFDTTILRRRITRRQIRLDRGSRPKAGKPPHIAHQPLAERTRAHCDMGDAVAAEGHGELVARQNHPQGSPCPSEPSLRRPFSPPSRAKSSSAALPCRTVSPTRSNPATAEPARRASPNSSTHRRANSASTRATRSAGAVTGRRAAREKSRFAAARSTISRRGVNHKPRPGSRASTSGTIEPSGATTKRSSAARSAVSPVAMQRRCGALDATDADRGSAVSVSWAIAVTATPCSPSRVRRAALILREPMGARGHDQRVGLVQFDLGTALVGAGEHFDQLVASQSGKIIERLHIVLDQGHQHACGQPFERGKFVGAAERVIALVVFLVAPFEGGAGALLQFGRDLLVESLDIRNVLDRDVSHLFERAETFGDQQVRDHVINIERVDEHLAAGAKLLGAALGFLGLGQDVDVPAGQLRGEPHVLASPADSQAQLIVGHDHLDTALLLVHHDLDDLGRRERVDDEGRRVRTTRE